MKPWKSVHQNLQGTDTKSDPVLAMRCFKNACEWKELTDHEKNENHDTINKDNNDNTKMNPNCNQAMDDFFENEEIQKSQKMSQSMMQKKKLSEQDEFAVHPTL